jgi:transposase-like protein
VQPQGRAGRRHRLRGARGRGTFANEPPPIVGMMQRGGLVVIPMLANGHQPTSAPVITHPVVPGSLVYTADYTSDGRLGAGGDEHTRGPHGVGESAREEEGDGCGEVQVHTLEGCWAWWRSWLRPHRGLSQAKLPPYRGLGECGHQIRPRGKALLPLLIELLVT